MTSAEITRKLTYEFMPKLLTMGIRVDPALPVHPTFLYESLWNIAIAALLFRMRTRKHFQGEVLFLYLIGYGVGRAFIEGLRTDSLMLGSLRISQFLSVLFVLVCLVILVTLRRQYPIRMTAEAIEEGGRPRGSADEGDGDRISGLDYRLGDADQLDSGGQGGGGAEAGGGQADSSAGGEYGYGGSESPDGGEYGSAGGEYGYGGSESPDGAEYGYSGAEGAGGEHGYDGANGSAGGYADGAAEPAGMHGADGAAHADSDSDGDGGWA
jgi:hypothetical protein